jgi:hypothetical protein
MACAAARWLAAIAGCGAAGKREVPDHISDQFQLILHDSKVLPMEV